MLSLRVRPTLLSWFRLNLVFGCTLNIISVHTSPGTAQWYSVRLRAVWSGVRVPAGAGNFSLHRRCVSIPALGPNQPPIQWVPGALSLGVKQPGCEAENSPPSNAEVKMRGAMPPFPNTPSWRDAQLKHRENFTYQSNIKLYFTWICNVTRRFITKNDLQYSTQRKVVVKLSLCLTKYLDMKTLCLALPYFTFITTFISLGA
jgi:hypothetical protein